MQGSCVGKIDVSTNGHNAYGSLFQHTHDRNATQQSKYVPWDYWSIVTIST